MKALVNSMTDNHPARPVLVLSNRAEAQGINWARAQGIATQIIASKPYGSDRHSFERAVVQALAPYQADILCLAGFMRVLTAEFVTPWKGRMLNIHPSLLPKYRGLNTHARALDAGDTVHGCSVHEVTANLDDGPILGQAQVQIEPNDTAETLAKRVLNKEHILYPSVLKRFAAGNREPLWL